MYLKYLLNSDLLKTFFFFFLFSILSYAKAIQNSCKAIATVRSELRLNISCGHTTDFYLGKSHLPRQFH